MLDQMQKTISLAELLADHKRFARDIKKSGTVYRVREPGRRKLALLDSHYMERVEATVEFLAAHPNWKTEFEQQDRGPWYDLEDVIAELGLERSLAKPPGAGRSRHRAARGHKKAPNGAADPRWSSAKRNPRAAR
jgi:hypothetical protein